MGMPEIPKIEIKKDEAINLLITSIAMEELSLAHIINAEGEKIQAVVAKFNKKNYPCSSQAKTTIEDLDLSEFNNELEGEDTVSKCKPKPKPEPETTVKDLLAVNESVRFMLKQVLKNNLVLECKLEDILDCTPKKCEKEDK